MTPRSSQRPLALLPALLLAACVSENPADGGFVSGVSGLSQGTYQARIDARNAAISTEEERGAALRAELRQREADYAALQRRLTAQRTQAAAAGRPIPADLDAQVEAVLQTVPSGRTEAERLQRYRAAVADARSLSERLAGLAD